jgi:hypothetical protein
MTSITERINNIRALTEIMRESPSEMAYAALEIEIVDQVKRLRCSQDPISTIADFILWDGRLGITTSDAAEARAREYCAEAHARAMKK